VLARLVLLLALGAWAPASWAEPLRYCERPVELSVRQQDVMLRFAGLIKTELENSGQRLALMARSGQDLHRLGHRYSHAGLSLQDSPNTPWSVRQLYYACEEQRPRIFDQGITGFVMGTNNPQLGYVSLLLLPDEAAQPLERAALDPRQALHVLASQYSANAYAYSDLFQNCNQWVVELMALAWGWPTPSVEPSRAELQAWLLSQQYQPSLMDVGWAPVVWAASLLPYVHNSDHPAADLAARHYRVTMPASLESFARQRYPDARRVELCHTEQRLVIHRGWEPLAEGCVAGEGDEVVLVRADEVGGKH
jgi:hypothetical protein